LRSVLASEYPNYEVLVVDNGSTDGSPEIVTELQKTHKNLFLVRNERNLGFAEGNNIGVGRARGDYVVLLNNDTVVIPDWLNPLAEILTKDPSVGACQSKLRLMNHPERLDAAGSYLSQYGFLVHVGLGEVDIGQYDEMRDIFVAKGAALTVRRKLWQAVGGLDPIYFAYNEEMDLCWRIWLAGYRVVFVPKSVALHAWGGTLSRMSNRGLYVLHFHGTKNYIMTLLKNLPPSGITITILKHTGIWLMLASYYLTKRKVTEALLILRAVLWNLSNLRSIWKRRQEVQWQMRTVPHETVMTKILRKVSMRYFYAFHHGLVPKLLEK